ncbi:Uncharacterized protein PCOAH_00029380 [Plasmodium coatneyi]|uniref:Uncharacterized protein n=1 Tax=Plasmodium coatneyi TaxID=208452 RepID=A0A1B1E104_9APIC|nr:Uncharacterized protein PCOAH_00029380 [Plasmodium coatneyi]ANQ08712.1 Uncharacterized protein PCOAH_00029380 [Plasmodium coatneyi]
MNMIKNIINQFIKLFGQEYLGEWDAIQNLTINSVTSPEILLKNVPFPEKLFELMELPFEIVYSNIKNLRIKFLWSSIFSNNISPINIYANDLFLVIKFSYPSLWDTNKIMNHQYKQKKTKLQKWDSINISKEKKEENFLKALPVKLVNSLRILVQNIKIVFFDNYIHKNPFTFEFLIKNFKIDELNKYNVKLTEEEKKNIKKNFLINIWIRMMGLHIIYKEYKKKIKYKKQMKKRKADLLHNSEKAHQGAFKSKGGSDDGREEYFLTAIENLFSESASSVHRGKRHSWRRAKRRSSLNNHILAKEFRSFSDYDIDDRIKDGNLKRKVRRQMRTGRFGKNLTPSESASKQKNKKKGKSNYNFEIPKHDLGFRITAKDGLDMHVVFKKYDMKALNELKNDLKCFKNVELSFVKHMQENIEDDFYNNVKIEEEEEHVKGTCYCYNYGNSNLTHLNNDAFFISNNPDGYESNDHLCNSELRNYDEIMERSFKNDYPPIFSDISAFESLNVFFTASALDSFYNFIKYIEFWFLYKGGCNKIFNIIPSIENCIKYSELRKLRNEKNYVYDRGTEDFLEMFEASCPIHLLTKLRILSDECIYSKEYFNNDNVKRREWKKLLYNFIKNQKGANTSIINENLEKLDKWFSHDMLFNLVIPKIQFTYIPIKYSHFSNSRVKSNKCLLSYTLACSFLFKQEKLSTIKKKMGIYFHNVDIHSLFVLFKKNKKFLMNKRKYCIHYVEKLPMRNFCLYHEPNSNNVSFYQFGHSNVGDDCVDSLERIHSKEERIIEKNFGHMMSGLIRQGGTEKGVLLEGADYYAASGDPPNGSGFLPNETLKPCNSAKRNSLAQGDRNGYENYLNGEGESANGILYNSSNTGSDQDGNLCMNSFNNYKMCKLFGRGYFDEKHLQGEDDGEKIQVENLRSLESEHIKNEREEGRCQNNNIPNRRNNRNTFWKFILGKQKKETLNNMKNHNDKPIEDNNFDRIINNQVVLIPNCLIIIINDYSNNVRDIDITICKYVINVNNLLPLVNFIPTSNTCLELFLKYDNYIDKEVIECICLCISKSVRKKKILRLRMDELKFYFYHSSYVQNEVVNLRSFLNKTRRSNNTRGNSRYQEKFIEHDLLLDPFKSLPDEKQSEMKMKGRKLHKGNMTTEGSDYVVRKHPNGAITNSSDHRGDVNNDSTSETTSISSEQSEEDHSGDELESHKKSNLHRSRSLDHFVKTQERDITNIHNIIFNNLFVAHRNFYHTKVNNTFSYLRKRNFLYSIRSRYYSFLWRYIQYNNNRSKVKNRNLLSIGVFGHVRNLFLFQDKTDSLLYLSARGVNVDHIFHTSFGNVKSSYHLCDRTDSAQGLRGEMHLEGCDPDQVSTADMVRNGPIGSISSCSIISTSDHRAGKSPRMTQNVTNRSPLFSIKSVKLKKNDNVLSLTVNLLNCNLNEMCVSLMGIHKHVLPLEHVELIKGRINKLKNIKQFLLSSNKNTVHLNRINVTNELLYKVLNRYFKLNHMVREKDTNSGDHPEKTENEFTVNKNYEKYIKKLVIKILDNEKILYNKEDFEKIFYMILRKRVTQQDNKEGSSVEGKKGTLPDYMTHHRRRMLNSYNSEMLHSFSSNNDIVQNYYTKRRERYANMTGTSKSLEWEYHTCKEGTMMSNPECEERSDLYNNSNYFNLDTARDSFSKDSEGGDQGRCKWKDHHEQGNNNEEKLFMQDRKEQYKDLASVKPSRRYNNEHCKYMNLRNLFNFDEILIDTEKIMGDDIFIHSSISSVELSQLDYLNGKEVEEKDTPQKKTSLFFFLISKTNVAISNKNEGIFKIVCNDFMSELTRMASSLNISLKMNTLYFFYILTISRKPKGGSLPKESNEKATNIFDEDKISNVRNNTCKKYVILTDWISNILSVSKSNLKKKKNSDLFNQYLCILERKKFKLFIDYDRKVKSPKPQLHLDLHINKQTNRKTVKLSLSNFNLFYSSTLFVLLNSVVINYFLTYIQEKEKVSILLCRYGTVLRNKGSQSNHVKHGPVRGKKERRDELVVVSLEKWVSSHEVVDTLRTSSNDSFIDETYTDNDISYNIYDQKRKHTDELNEDTINLTNNTFYYDFSENENGTQRNIQRNAFHQNEQCEDNPLCDVTRGVVSENGSNAVSRGLYNDLYYRQKVTNSGKAKRKITVDDTCGRFASKRRFNDTSGNLHGLAPNVNSNENVNPHDNINQDDNVKAQKWRKKNLSFLKSDMKRDVICTGISFAKDDPSECDLSKGRHEGGFINEDNTFVAQSEVLPNDQTSNNAYHDQLANNCDTPPSVINSKDENLEVGGDSPKEEVSQKVINVDNNRTRINTVPKNIFARHNSKRRRSTREGQNVTENILRRNKKVCHAVAQHQGEVPSSRRNTHNIEEEKSQNSAGINLFVCSENVNICYLINYHRFKYVYKKNHKVDAYMNDYMNFIDSCSNYSKQEKKKEGENLDHIGIMNKDLYNFNLNFLFKLEYKCTQNKKKSISAFFPFLYIILMKNCNYVISHLTIVDVKVSAHFLCKCEEEEKKKINKSKHLQRKNTPQMYDKAMLNYLPEEQSYFGQEETRAAEKWNTSGNAHRSSHSSCDNLAMKYYDRVSDKPECTSSNGENSLTDSCIIARHMNSSLSINKRISQSRNNENNSDLLYDLTVKKGIIRSGNDPSPEGTSECTDHDNREKHDAERNNSLNLTGGMNQAESISSERKMSKQKSYMRFLFNYKKPDLAQTGEGEPTSAFRGSSANSGSITNSVSRRKNLLKHLNSVVNFMGKNNSSSKSILKKDNTTRRSLSLFSFKTPAFLHKKAGRWNSNTLEVVRTEGGKNNASYDLGSVNTQKSECISEEEGKDGKHQMEDRLKFAHHSSDNFVSISQQGSFYHVGDEQFMGNSTKGMNRMAGDHSKCRNSLESVPMNNEQDEFNKRSQKEKKKFQQLEGDKKKTAMWKLSRCNLSVYNINLFSCIYLRRFKRGKQKYLQPLVYNYKHANGVHSFQGNRNANEFCNPSFVQSSFETYANFKTTNYDKLTRNNYVLEKDLKFLEYINQVYSLEWFNKFNVHHLCNINKIHSSVSRFMCLNGRGRPDCTADNIVCCYVPIFYKHISASYRNVYKFLLLTKYYESVHYLPRLCEKGGVSHINGGGDLYKRSRNGIKNQHLDRNTLKERSSGVHEMDEKLLQLNTNGADRHKSDTKKAKARSTDNHTNRGKGKKKKKAHMFGGNDKTFNVNKYQLLNYEGTLQKKRKTNGTTNFTHPLNDVTDASVAEEGKAFYYDDASDLFENDEMITDPLGKCTLPGDNNFNSFNNYLIYKRDFLKYSSWKENHLYVSLKQVECYDKGKDNTNRHSKRSVKKHGNKSKSKRTKQCFNFYIHMHASSINLDPYFISTYNFYLVNNLNKNLIAYDIKETKDYFIHKYKEMKQYYRQTIGWSEHLESGRTELRASSSEGEEIPGRVKNVPLERRHNENNLQGGGPTKCCSIYDEEEGKTPEELFSFGPPKTLKLFRLMNSLNNLTNKISEKLKNNKVIINVDIKNVDVNVLDCSYIYDSKYLLVDHVHPFYNNQYVYMSKEKYERIRRKKGNHSNDFSNLESMENKHFSSTINNLIFNRLTNYYNDNSFYIVSINASKVKRISIQLYTTVILNNFVKKENVKDVLSVIVYNYRMKFSSLRIKKVKNIMKEGKQDIIKMLDEMGLDETEDTTKRKRKKHRKGKGRSSRPERNNHLNMYKQFRRSNSKLHNFGWFVSNDSAEGGTSFIPTPPTASSWSSSEPTSVPLSAATSSQSTSINSLLSYDSNVERAVPQMGYEVEKGRRHRSTCEPFRLSKRRKLKEAALQLRRRHRRESNSFSDSIYTKHSTSLRKQVDMFNDENGKSMSFHNFWTHSGHETDKHAQYERRIKKKKVKNKFYNYIRKIYNNMTSKQKKKKLILDNIVENNKWSVSVENLIFYLPQFKKGFKFYLYLNKFIIYDYNQIKICNNISQFRLFLGNNAERKYLQLCNKIMRTFNHLHLNKDLLKGNLRRKIVLKKLNQEIYNNQLYIIANEGINNIDFILDVKNTRLTLHNQTIMDLVNYFTELSISIFSFLYVYTIYPEVSFFAVSYLSSCMNVDNFQKGLLLYNNLLKNYIGTCKRGKPQNGSLMSISSCNNSNNNNRNASFASGNNMVDLERSPIEQSNSCEDPNRSDNNSVNSLDRLEKANPSGKANATHKRRQNGSEHASDISNINILMEKMISHKNKINYKYLIMNKFEYQTKAHNSLKELHDKNYYFLAFVSNNLLFFLYFYTKYRTVLNFVSTEDVFNLRPNYVYPIRRIKHRPLVKVNKICENIRTKKKFMHVGKKYMQREQLKVSTSKIMEKKKKRKRKLKKYIRYNKQEGGHNAHKKVNPLYEPNVSSPLSWKEHSYRPGEKEKKGKKEPFPVKHLKMEKYNTQDNTNTDPIRNEHEGIIPGSSLGSMTNQKTVVKSGSVIYDKINNDEAEEYKKKEDSKEGAHEVKGFSTKLKTTIRKFFTRKLSSQGLGNKNLRDEKKRDSMSNTSNELFYTDYKTVLHELRDKSDVSASKKHLTSLHNVHFFRNKSISLRMKVTLFETWVIQEDLFNVDNEKKKNVRVSSFLKKKKKKNFLASSSLDNHKSPRGERQMRGKRRLSRNMINESNSCGEDNLYEEVEEAQNLSIKSVSSTNSGSNVNILNILEKSKNYFNTFMNKKINKQIFYLARRRASKNDLEDFSENARTIIRGKKNNVKGREVGKNIVRLNQGNTADSQIEVESSSLSDYTYRKDKAMSLILGESNSNMYIHADRYVGEKDLYKAMAKQKIKKWNEYHKWEKKKQKRKNIRENNRNICLSIIFSVDTYYKEQQKLDYSKFKIEVNNLNIMLGKCFSFSDIYDQLKLYRSDNNFRASVYASGIFDLNHLHDAFNRERNYAYVKKLPNRKDKVSNNEMEYAFYDNTNFYNIYYNEMRDVKVARRMIRSGKRKSHRSNNHHHVQGDLSPRGDTFSGEEVPNVGTSSVEKQSDRYLSSGGITDDLSSEGENEPFNPAKKSITFSSTHEAELSEHAKKKRHNFEGDMSKWNSSEFYGNRSRKQNQEKKTHVRRSNLFILMNKNRIIYKDKFNIFLNHNNNIFMPNIKDENDWLLSINSVYLFANSLSGKRSFNVSCHELLINLTIDNIKELYKLHANFNYNIYYAGFYRNYLSFVKNIYVLPFLHKDKTCTEKSNEKLKINGVYLNSMNRLKVTDKSTLHNKFKVTKRMNSADSSLYGVKYSKEFTDSSDEYPPISLKSPRGKEDPYDTLPNGTTNHRNDRMDGHPSEAASPNGSNKFGILSKKREGVLIKDKSQGRNKCISFNNMNEIIDETDEERNEKNEQKKDEQEGDVYNLIREKTLHVRDMEEDENYINNDITTMYTVRKYFLIQNFNIYKKMVHYYGKMQTFIDLDGRNAKYSEIIHTLKETYVKIEQYRENLYHLYSQLFSIIRNINDEKNIICHGLVFVKLLNCLYSYSNKYVTNLFYYLFVFSKYNKFAEYLCSIQKYFDYKYFTYFTNKIGNVDACNVRERMSREITHGVSYNNSGMSPHEKGISMLPNSGNNPIMNEDFALHKEINENIKKEEMLKENEVTKKNLSCFIISSLLYLYRPYMYRHKKCVPMTNRKKENLKTMFKRKQRLSSLSEEDGLLERHSSSFYQMGKSEETKHTHVGNQMNDIYRMDGGMEENILTKFNALSQKEGKKIEIRKNKSYMFHKKGIKIKIKIRVNNVCLKIHQLNKENILTLNLYDLNYYMFTCLYQYHFFFHKTNEHVGFYLNDKVEKIKFEDIYAITEKSEMKKRVNSNLYMDSLWYEVSAEESAIQDKLYNIQWGDKKEKKKKKKKLY